MDWGRILAHITGAVDQELNLRNEYLAAENRILKTQIKGRLLLTDVEKATLAETDFFSVEVLTLRGLATYYVLFFIHLESRKVEIAGMTPHPNEAWMPPPSCRRNKTSSIGYRHAINKLRRS
jgi:hypothetical protein